MLPAVEHSSSSVISGFSKSRANGISDNECQDYLNHESEGGQLFRHFILMHGVRRRGLYDKHTLELYFYIMRVATTHLTASTDLANNIHRVRTIEISN